eukprot:COSAG04_NODE_1015_length_8749_cov_6.684277_2_plen_54_part_00
MLLDEGVGRIGRQAIEAAVRAAEEVDMKTCIDTVTSAFSFCSAPATRPQNDHT